MVALQFHPGDGAAAGIDVSVDGPVVDAGVGTHDTDTLVQQRLRGDEVVDLLLKLGADVNLKANGGQTLLHFVASKGNIEIARKLLNHTPAASTRVPDKQGQYPIHRAAAAGWTPMVRLLLQHKSPLDATDVSGFTALHHAVAEGHGDTAVALLQAGAEAGKRNIDGKLAIDIAPDAEVQKYIKRAAELEGIQL